MAYYDINYFMSIQCKPCEYVTKYFYDNFSHINEITPRFHVLTWFLPPINLGIAASNTARCQEATNTYDEVIILGDWCYAFKVDQVSWFIAEQRCESDGMQLAPIDS